MGLISKTLIIQGMTCINCESKIEKELKRTNGLVTVNVSYINANLLITFDEDIISLLEIKNIISELDYEVVNDNLNKNVTKKKPRIIQFIGIVFILLAFFVIINNIGGFNFFNTFPTAKVGMGYGTLFLIGVFTSIHCIAMCGGINMSQSITSNDLDDKKKINIRSSLLYNLGRVISYTIIGGIVGLIGSTVSFSGTARGLVAIISGVFMMIMGLNMLEIFPWLRKFNPQIPKVFRRKITKQKRSNNPLYIGLLNGLMPCGPLQAMQIYALSTGDPLQGAISMLIFSLGTVPLMFGLGVLSSLFTKKFHHKMLSVSATLVILLGVFMFSNGLSLSGYNMPNIFGGNSETISKVDGNIQTITTTLEANNYPVISVKKGVLVKWTIVADETNLNGCNNRIIISKLGIEKELTVGENIIEFIPEESGTIPFSCWMGMIKSHITVN